MVTIIFICYGSDRVFSIRKTCHPPDAEVDFVLYKNDEHFIPIEVKYRNMNRLQISRGFRSFIEAYQPKYAIFITKDKQGKMEVNNCEIHFISINHLTEMFKLIKQALVL